MAVSGYILVALSIALITHSFFLVQGNKEFRESENNGASAAQQAFDIVNGVESTRAAAPSAAAAAAAAAAASSASGGAVGGGRIARLIVYGELAGALLLAIVGVAVVTAGAMRTAQRVEVNAASPHATFDSVVYSGADFSHTNHRGRRLGRVDGSR